MLNPLNAERSNQQQLILTLKSKYLIKAVRFLLFPLAILFDIITSIRNRLYELGYKPSARFDLPVISVGNLAVGGTGKTPMVEHLIRLLKSNYIVATLSRGYGRQTKGFRLASDSDNALTLGDEPFQFYKKFGREINVSVGEERALAIPYLLDLYPETEVILLDDAFQHRKVKPSFQILLSDYNNPFYKDFLLPAGNLRESRVGADRADVIVVTKCPPELEGDEMMEIEADIRKYANKPVFFTAIHYGNVIPFGNDTTAFPDKVILVTGIANARPLEHFVAGSFNIIKYFGFSDHYAYTKKDMEMITAFAKKHDSAIITTEKDFVKMDREEFQVFLSGAPFFYLPIEVEFLKNGKDFDEMVLNAVKNA